MNSVAWLIECTVVCVVLFRRGAPARVQSEIYGYSPSGPSLQATSCFSVGSESETGGPHVPMESYNDRLIVAVELRRSRWLQDQVRLVRCPDRYCSNSICLMNVTLPLSFLTTL